MIGAEIREEHGQIAAKIMQSCLSEGLLIFNRDLVSFDYSLLLPFVSRNFSCNGNPAKSYFAAFLK